MNEFQIQQILRGILAPAVVSGGLLILGRLLPTRIRPFWRGLGAALGFLTAFVLMRGWPSWPYLGSPSALMAAVLFSAAWPLLEGRFYRRIWLTRYFLGAGLGLLVLHPLIQSGWSMNQTLSTILVLATSFTFAWLVVERAGQNVTMVGVSAVLGVVCLGAGALMMSEGSALLAQLTGAVGVIIGVAGVLALVRFFAMEFEIVPFAVTMLFSLMVGHFFFVEASLQNWLLVLAPLALLAMRMSFGGVAKNPLAHAVSLGVLSLVPVAYLLWQIRENL